MMRLISLNLGRAQPLANGKQVEMTGIFKAPVAAPVRVTRLGVSGDTVVDTENHGGVDQAVYVYGLPDYAWWSATLGADLAPGTFGENMTVEGLESAALSVGDRLCVDDVVLEVTAARIPCSTLAARMGDPAFVKRFRRAERPGVYCRVIQEGEVRIGAPVEYLPYAGETITIVDMFREWYNPRQSADSIRRHLAAPIAVRARVEQEARLSKLLAEDRR